MRLGLLIFLIFLAVAGSSTAHAGFFFSNRELKQALAAPEITVGDIALNKSDLNAFYQTRDYSYAWDHHNGLSTALTAFIDSAENVISWHGLSREDYALDQLRQLAQDTSGNNDLNIELLTTDILLQLSYDLHGDGYDLSDLYPGWNYHRPATNIPARLAEAVTNGKLDSFIDSLAPRNPTYEKLAQTLQHYRTIAAHGGWPAIDAGPPLRLHDTGKRVDQLRQRLTAEGYLLPPPDAPKKGKKHRLSFDEAMEEAIRAFQRHNGLEDVGYAGKLTLEILNIPLVTRINQIRANMERWRHMPDDFPAPRHALINIPAMTIEISEDNKPIYSGIVIVGRVDRKTPFIQSAIRSMIINPSWHVPLKIARQDILPKLKKDPHYLEKMGFVISGSADDPHGKDIDWDALPENEFKFRLRQSPGDLNSLGYLKFDFDNDFAVYMHGTPHHELFEKSERAFSSGCIRLHDPEQIGEIVTAANKDPWNAQRIVDEVKGGKTRWIGVAKPLPLYVLYWTVFPNAEGEIEFRKDIYDYDRFLIDVMENRDTEYPPQPTEIKQ